MIKGRFWIARGMQLFNITPLYLNKGNLSNASTLLFMTLLLQPSPTCKDQDHSRISSCHYPPRSIAGNFLHVDTTQFGSKLSSDVLGLTIAGFRAMIIFFQGSEASQQLADFSIAIMLVAGDAGHRRCTVGIDGVAVLPVSWQGGLDDATGSTVGNAQHECHGFRPTFVVRALRPDERAEFTIRCYFDKACVGGYWRDRKDEKIY